MVLAGICIECWLPGLAYWEAVDSMMWDPVGDPEVKFLSIVGPCLLFSCLYPGGEIYGYVLPCIPVMMCNLAIKPNATEPANHTLEHLKLHKMTLLKYKLTKVFFIAIES